MSTENGRVETRLCTEGGETAVSKLGENSSIVNRKQTFSNFARKLV